jgi:hypothetical protein
MSTEDVHDACEAGNRTADELQTTTDALFLRLNEIVELFQSLCPDPEGRLTGADIDG